MVSLADVRFGFDRIVKCSRNSSLPINLGTTGDNNIQKQLTDFQARLQPRTLLCIGRPFPHVARIMKYLFPKVSRLIVKEDSRYQLFDDANDCLPTGVQSGHSLDALARFNNLVSNYCNDNSQLETAIVLRYRLHRAYQQLVSDCPGQRLHVLRATTAGGDVVHIRCMAERFSFSAKGHLGRMREFPISRILAISC